MTHQQHVDLHKQLPPDEDISVVCDLLREATQLTSLDLSGNKLRQGTLEKIVSALLHNAHHKNLTELDVSETQLTDMGTVVFTTQALHTHHCAVPVM